MVVSGSQWDSKCDVSSVGVGVGNRLRRGGVNLSQGGMNRLNRGSGFETSRCDVKLDLKLDRRALKCLRVGVKGEEKKSAREEWKGNKIW